jgi:copper resistance protein C
MICEMVSMGLPDGPGARAYAPPMTPRIGRMRLLAPVIAISALALLPSIAAAHAELVRAIPDQGATVTVPVTVVTGRYSEDITGNSHLDVKDATGATVATGGIDPEDPRRLIARPATPLTSGSFTVESTTISAQDGDIDRTKWTFTVTAAASSEPPASSAPPSTGSPEASSPPPSPAATPTAPSTEPSAAPSPSPSSGTGTPATSDSSVILPIVAALAIIVIGAAFLLNRGRGSGTAA